MHKTGASLVSYAKNSLTVAESHMFGECGAE